MLNKTKTILIFGAIMAVGIFLRTYNFHDWLRFNPDQARDAAIVSAAIEGKSSLPLLGPRAGGTEFKLGPAFYYFQYAGAKLFGDYPDKMAYPDLIFSILAIPLLYFLLKKYFSGNISLVLTAIFSISLYAIKYSRFAWNPNSIPFWTMLFIFSVLEIINGKKSKIWPVLAGLSAGVAVQLHTSLLILLPAMLFFIFARLIWKKIHSKKNIAVILALIIFLNLPQIFSEIKNRGANSMAFWGGITLKSEKNKSFSENLFQNTACYVRGSAQIISYYKSSDSCRLFSKKGNWIDKYGFSAVSGIFLFGGLSLAFYFRRKEADPEKRNFLNLVLVYFFLSFLVFIPLANEISMRFFLILIFMPFALLGIWIKFFLKFKKYGKFLAGLLAATLIFLNFFAIRKAYLAFSGKINGYEDANIVTLGDAEDMIKYIKEKTENSKKSFISGKNQFVFKYEKPLDYLAEKNNLDIEVVDNNKIVPGETIFLIMDEKSAEEIQKSGSSKFKVLDSRIFRRTGIIKARY